MKKSVLTLPLLALAIATAGCSEPSATAQPQAQAAPGRTAEETRNLATVERSFADWAAGRGSPFDLLAPDYRWTILGPTPSAGVYNRARMNRDVLAPFNANMATPLTPSVRRLYADGDTVVALFEATGRRKDGQPYANSYAWFMRMRNGRIAEVDAVLDLHAFDEVIASSTSQ